MRRGGRTLRCMLVASLVLSVTLFCGPDAVVAEPGVTETEILVGCTADLSGPIAFLGKGITDGARLYFEYLNDRGGVHGRRVRLLVEDDGYQSPRAMQAARKLVTRDNVFCMFMVLGSTAVNAMYPFLEARSVPLFFPGTQERGMAYPPRKYLFLLEPNYTIMATVGVEYFVENLEREAIRIAVIYQDDAPGHDWLRGVRIATEHYGIDILAQLPYRRGSVDFSSQVARCKNLGVTHLFMYTIIREPAMILKEAQRQQYRATFVTSFASMNNTTLRLCGDSIDYSKGFYGFGSAIMDFDNPNPAMRKYMDVAERYGYDYSNYADQPMTLGYLCAEFLVEGFRRAGRDLTREGMIRAVESFDRVDNGITGPVTFGPDRRDGARSVVIGKAVDGTWVSLLPDGVTRYSSIPEQ